MSAMGVVTAVTALHRTVTAGAVVELVVIQAMAELGDHKKQMVMTDLVVVAVVVHHLNHPLIMAVVVSIHMAKEPLALAAQ